MSEFDAGDADPERLGALQGLEGLTDTLRDRPAGDWFRADLEEARAIAERDPRFAELAAGLEAKTLGGRLDAINAFFDAIDNVELAGLTLPPNLSQLRAIYLSSHM